jgi:2-polyprenyl-3-methyl-5-hydroxy-6-metoxy-1,4-benzoquinol methylase
MKNKKNKFEEYYFEGYYKGIADFTKKREKELQNWFRGVLESIDSYYKIKNGKEKSLIEFGCASGAAASIFKSFGYDVTATDVSRYAVNKAKKTYERIKFSVEDIQKPRLKRQYDISVAFDVIEHLANPLSAVKCVEKLLKKDGVAIFTTPNVYPHVFNDPTHINVKKPSEWEKIFINAGFKNIFMKQITFLPYFYRWHWRLALSMPFPSSFKYVISPVIIIAKK